MPKRINTTPRIFSHLSRTKLSLLIINTKNSLIFRDELFKVLTPIRRLLATRIFDTVATQVYQIEAITGLPLRLDTVAIL